MKIRKLGETVRLIQKDQTERDQADSEGGKGIIVRGVVLAPAAVKTDGDSRTDVATDSTTLLVHGAAARKLLGGLDQIFRYFLLG